MPSSINVKYSNVQKEDEVFYATSQEFHIPFDLKRGRFSLTLELIYVKVGECYHYELVVLADGEDMDCNCLKPHNLRTSSLDEVSTLKQEQISH